MKKLNLRQWALIGIPVIACGVVIPVGGQGAQRLLRLTRTDDGFDEEMLAHVSFVPLVKGTG